MDREAQAASLSNQFERCAELIGAITDPGWDGRGQRGRLIVLESSFRGIGVCEWLDEPMPDEGAATAWLRQHNRPGAGSLDEAAKLVRGPLPTQIPGSPAE